MTQVRLVGLRNTLGRYLQSDWSDSPNAFEEWNTSFFSSFMLYCRIFMRFCLNCMISKWLRRMSMVKILMRHSCDTHATLMRQFVIDNNSFIDLDLTDINIAFEHGFHTLLS